ncbi:MAG: histidine phosphatase family protein, partial [Bacteroidota bacterium]
YPFDRVYTSALQRTHQSVARFIQEGPPHESLSQFNEIHWGNKEGQPFTPESQNFYETTINAWASGDLDAKIDEGESAREMGKRLQEGLEYVLGQPGDQILICMHGRAMRALLAIMLEKPLSDMDQFHHTNLCLYELTYTAGKFTLDKFNEQAHLEGVTVED